MDTDSSQIVEITPEGITYVDKDGKRRFIDFAECFNNAVKWKFDTPATTAQMAERAKRVGDVYYLGDLDDPYSDIHSEDSRPYAGFYDDQVTFINFSGQDECQAFCEKLIGLGWGLFDQSD